jgi:ATP-dependent RNA helicase DeaD
MSMQAQQKEHGAAAAIQANPLQGDNSKGEGDFDNFPEITEKTKQTLRARGITHLFPV